MSEELVQDTGEQVEVAAPQETQSQEAMEAEQERNVPLAALEAERSQRQRLQDELGMIKEHLNLLQAQRSAPQPEQESLAEDDVMTYGEFKKAAAKFQNDIKSTLSELQMSKKYPDYEEVVRKYLPEVIKEDPEIAKTLQATQDYKLAYRLAKSTEGYRKDHKKQTKNADAERVIANSGKAGSLSSVGGTTPISMAKRYQDMSDDDFRKEVAKNMGHF